MSAPAFVIAKFDGERWTPSPAGYSSREEAIEGIRLHHKTNGGGEAVLRVYEGDGGDWKPTLVELTRSGNSGPMSVLAVYKIISGEWASGRPSN